MKKSVIAILLLFALILSACSSIPTPVHGRRHLIDENCSPYAKQAVSIFERYIGFELSKEQARDEMKELWERAEYLDSKYEYNTVEHRFLFALHYDYYDFSRPDSEIRSDCDMVKFMLGVGANVAEYSCDNPQKAEEFGFNPLDIVSYSEPDNDSDFHRFDIVATEPFEKERFKMALENVIKDVMSGSLGDGVVIYAHDSTTDYIGNVATGAFSISNGEYACYFYVTQDEMKFAYLFGASEEIAEMYRKTDKNKLGYDEVYSQEEPLTAEQAAQFFVDCLPE